MVIIPAPRILLRVKAPGGDWVRYDPTRCKSLDYTDSEKKADQLSLEIRNDDELYPDDHTFDLGTVLRAQWGATTLRSEREFIIQKWSAGVPSFKVEAHGAAILFHKDRRVQSWERRKRSDVVREIATRNGFPPENQYIEDTELVIDAIHQGAKGGGQTDAEFCRLLAKSESSNGTEFVFYIINGEWHFHRRRYDQQPRRTITYVGPGMGEMRGYPQFEATAMPAAKGASAGKGAGAIAATGIDPLTKEPITATANDKETAGRPGLADEVLLVSRESGAASFQTAPATATPTATNASTLGTSASTTTTAGGAKNQKELARAVTSAWSAANAKPTKCSLTITGDPTLEARQIVVLDGISQRLGGAWYISELKDSIKAGDYSTSLTLNKDGLNKGGAKQGATSPTTTTDDANKDSSAQKNDQPAADGQKLEERLVVSEQSGSRRVEFAPQGSAVKP